MTDLTKIGKKCRNFRKSIRKTQKDVANELNYSVASVSAFERGCNNNAIILLWYIEKGVKMYV